MDNGDKDNWIAPILFGVAALSIYSIARTSNQPEPIPELDENGEFNALMHYNHEIHNKLEEFLNSSEDNSS